MKYCPRSILIFCAGFVLCGCESVAYYAQAIGGHARLIHERQAIADLLRAPDVPPQRRRRLQRALEIRDYAVAVLGLPDNGSYRSYVDLGARAVVWSVVATPELSVEPLQWCYPVIGCAAYRAYFAEDRARAKARQLAAQGRDVTVGAVPAYSTLGWFDDPLPSTAIDWPEPRLAGLIFHELAHQQLYVADDSTFNESFAAAVEQAGTRRWLQRQGNAGALADWDAERAREQAFRDLLMNTRQALAQLYAGGLPVPHLRERKTRLLQGLRERYRTLRAAWPADRGFDAWFERPLNNARLASINTYAHWVPALLELLHRENGDFPSFYAAARHLSELAPAPRNAALQELDQAARRRHQSKRRSAA